MKKYKTLLCAALIAVMVFSLALESGAASSSVGDKIRIRMNGVFLDCDQDPVIIDGRTLVPLRVIFEALGAEVEWDNSTRTAIATRGDKKIEITIDKPTMLLSDRLFSNREVTLDVPASIISGRTMIPVRAVAECFDCGVKWNGYAKYVVILPFNQTPYKIDAVNEKGTVLATAYFDSLGRLTKTYSNSKDVYAHCYLAPMYVNIDGNTYIDQMRTAINSDGLNTIDYDDSYNVKSFTQNVKTYYTYEYNSNGSRKSTHYNGSDLDKLDYLYEGNQVASPTGFGEESGQPQYDFLVFDNMGMLTEYRYYAMRINWEYKFGYDEHGRMTDWYYSGSGGQTASYTYGADGKIESATLNDPSTGTKTTVTYKYSEQ